MPRPRGDERPKGRMSPYAFFVQACREEHKKKHPDEPVIFTEFSKKCAEMWNEMFDHEKQRFYDMAEEDKKRYDLQMQGYVPTNSETGRVKKRRNPKDPNAPKRPLPAFFWFCSDQRSKIKAMSPELGMVDIAKELGRRWPYVDPDLRSRYEVMAEKDKARYDRELAIYKRAIKKEESEEEDEV